MKRLKGARIPGQTNLPQVGQLPRQVKIKGLKRTRVGTGKKMATLADLKKQIPKGGLLNKGLRKGFGSIKGLK